MGRFAYSAVLPSMQVGLDLGNTRAGNLATISLIGYLTLAVIGGALASHLGPRLVISCALALAGVGMFVTAAAPGFGVAAAGAFLTGMGSGAGNVASMGLVSAWFGPRQRGLAAGIAVSGISGGLIVVGPLVPRILHAYPENGWRVSWLVFGATTIALALAAAVLIRDRPADKGLTAIGDEARLAPPTKTAVETRPGRGATTQGSGAADARAPIPAGELRSLGLHWGSVYRSSTVWHLGLVYVAFGFSYIIFTTFFYKRLMSDGGYSKEAAGTLFMAVGWVSLLCGVIWGRVADRVGRKAALIMVYLVQAAAYTIFALWASPTGFTIGAVLFGLTAWSIPAIMAAACGNIMGPRLASAALGFITLFFSVGQAAGPSVAGAMADASGTFAPAYLLAGGVALMGAVGASLLRGRQPATQAAVAEPENA